MKIEPFEDASERYLNWLGTKLTLVPTEVEKRRTRLAASTPFEFLRATFYRWAQVWPEVCPELNRDKVPLVLGVGDLHAENFGTWRDGEGRLVWGVNDFDECGYLPYTNDLVRLAASVRFGIEDQAIAALKKVRKLPGQKRRAEVLRQIKELRERKEVRKQVKAIFPAACRAILGGYCDGLNLKFKADKESMEQTGKGREPIILAERHDWLREIVLNKLRGKTTAGNDANAPSKANDFAEFFAEMNALPPINAVVPRSAWDAINQTMPEPDLKFRLCKREAGLGSLGRQRFTAVVEQWCGGILVREAKSLAPSAWLWWDEKRRD
ncbi:MAG TPA: DUF2252 family protein, partial [Blastocatellia bacterium]|nr:DUF2252 family protein [Blastocatellia bacterium]